MLRANFFYRFFKYKQNKNYGIIKYNSNENSDLASQINIEIIGIDQKISENSSALIEAQIVKLRSTFSKSNNFIESLGKNIYRSKIDESIDWHKNKLKELYDRRRELQINLEKIKGIFWINRIKRFLQIILIGIIFLLILFVFLSGFMIIIYLMPVLILIFFGYLIATKT